MIRYVKATILCQEWMRPKTVVVTVNVDTEKPMTLQEIYYATDAIIRKELVDPSVDPNKALIGDYVCIGSTDDTVLFLD